MPEWIEHLRPRLACLRLSASREAEIIEELSQHLDQRYEELKGRGASDDDAQRLALEELCEPDALARHRFRAVLVMSFAGLALLLAMVGLFGVLAYSVRQRVRDFGVRSALGASTSDVLGLVIGSAVRVMATGAVIGLALSTVLGRLLAGMLFGVQPLDPRTFASVVIVLALTGAVSIAGPAWRATRVDPAVALRVE